MVSLDSEEVAPVAAEAAPPYVLDQLELHDDVGPVMTHEEVHTPALVAEASELSVVGAEVSVGATELSATDVATPPITV